MSYINGPTDPFVVLYPRNIFKSLTSRGRVPLSGLSTDILQKQVEECCGKGAVRTTRVRHVVSSSSCIVWCTVLLMTSVVMCIAVAAKWVAEQINNLEEQAERAVASVSFIGVPVAIVVWMIKV